MVQAVRHNHQRASRQRDADFPSVGGQPISTPCSTRDTAQPRTHEQQHRLLPVPPKACQQSHRATQRHQQRQRAMRGFFAGQKMRKYR